jgi:hypothetical protein
MRIRSGSVVLAICLLMGQSAIAALPDVASAEWTEAGRPCNVAPWAILPQPAYWFSEVGEPGVPPTGYFTYGETPEEAPPTSNFTASANWGDGTTSPATVGGSSVGDCYGVSTPSHTYTSTGAYPFSYTVHDMKTGLDHMLGATELHIWSEIPRLLGGSSSRTIQATVDAPWSGVVGEFSSEGTVNSSYPYNAQIEWGDGEPSTSGTISTQGGSNTFTVSGSFTYAHPFIGTISVLLWHGAQLLGKWTTSGVGVQGMATADRTPPARVRLSGQPILAAIPSAAGGPIYELVFRTNRPLTQTSSGHVEALIEIHGRTNPISGLVPHRASTCYVARTNRIGKRRLKLGTSYPFTLAIGEGSTTRDSGHALLHQFASLNRMRSVTSRQLGCA